MGVTITSLGDLGYDHEGYVANGLDTGEWTGTTSPDTRPRMTGSLRAQCACGWHADRVWASDTPAGQFPSDDLEDQILTDWRDHVHALVDSKRDDAINHLNMLMTRLGRQYNTGIDLDNLDDLERDLHTALRLTKQLRQSTSTVKES